MHQTLGKRMMFTHQVTKYWQRLFNQDGKACQAQTLQLIAKMYKLRTKAFYNFGPRYWLELYPQSRTLNIFANCKLSSQTHQHTPTCYYQTLSDSNYYLNVISQCVHANLAMLEAYPWSKAQKMLANIRQRRLTYQLTITLVLSNNQQLQMLP